MHKQKDQMAKRIAVEILDPYGRAQPEKEIPSPDAQSMDLWYETDQEPPPEQELPSYLRLPIRMGRRAAHFEFCSTLLDSRGARQIQRKQLEWDHQRYLKARRRGQREPPLFPTWIIMPSKPVAYFRRRRVRRAPGLPLGFYCTDEESELWFVVVNELPRTRQTLVLRLLRSERSRAQALLDIRRIPEEDLELPKLLAVVEQLRTAVERDKTIPVRRKDAVHDRSQSRGDPA